MRKSIFPPQNLSIKKVLNAMCFSITHFYALLSSHGFIHLLVFWHAEGFNVQSQAAQAPSVFPLMYFVGAPQWRLILWETAWGDHLIAEEGVSRIKWTFNAINCFICIIFRLLGSFWQLGQMLQKWSQNWAAQLNTRHSYYSIRSPNCLLIV